MGTAYIIDAVRTPRGKGKPNGALAGCVQQVGEQGACIGRMAALAAGWPDVVSGVSLNRFVIVTATSKAPHSLVKFSGARQGKFDLSVASGYRKYVAAPILGAKRNGAAE